MLKSLVCSLLCIGVSGAPLLNQDRVSINNTSIVDFTEQAVIYDDEYYTFTFSLEELSYHYDNLANYLNNNFDTLSNDDFNLTLITYDNDNYELEEFLFQDQVYWSYGTVNIIFSLDENYRWTCFDNATLTELDFEYGFIWNVSTLSIANVDDMYNAIELDTQANQTAENNMPSVSDLFGYITQGVNAFIGSLGQAFESVVALFWDATATTPGPTFLGLLMLISIGAGLIYLAYNVIKKLVYRLRG